MYMLCMFSFINMIFFRGFFTQPNHNMIFFFSCILIKQIDQNNVCRSKFEDRLNRFKSYGRKSGQIWVRKRFFEKISRNMIVAKKLMMTNIKGNFIADNIVFGMEVLAHHPEKLSLEIWEFTNFHRVFKLSSGYEAYLR